MSSWLHVPGGLLTGLPFFDNWEFIVIIYHMKDILLSFMKMSASTTSQDLYGMSKCSAVLCNCMCWYSRYAEYCSTIGCGMTDNLLYTIKDPIYMKCAHCTHVYAA